MKSGVYKIVNIVNGKLYVGSSTNVKYRLWRHTHELRRNVHENISKMLGINMVKLVFLL